MRSLHISISIILIITANLELDAQTLTASNSNTDGNSCVGESLLFTCVANNTTVLSWYVGPVIISGEERGLHFTSQFDQIGMQFSSHNFTATLVNKVQNSSDNIYADLVSTLEVTITPELNGSRVWCSATGLGNGDVFRNISVKGPPSPPRGLNYTVLDSDLQNITLLIQWSIQNNNATEVFLIFIHSMAVNHAINSNATKIILILSYNENYNISVKAVNCAGESQADVLHINIIGCDHPRPPESGTIKPYHSLAERSEISYHCNTGYTPHEEMTAVCTHQGVWSHNPNELECLRDCGIPHPPLNGYVEPYNSTVEGGELFYQCREGYSPSDVRMRAVCTAEGVWDPNPSHLLCRDTHSDLDSNEVLDKKFMIIISLAVVSSLLLILCVILLGSLFLCWKKQYRRTTAEPPPAMVTVSSDPQYEEILTHVGEESFVLRENAAYGPRQKD